MASIALVANRGSGSGAVAPDEVEARLEALGASVVAFDRADARQAAASGADRVALAGGDGSVGPVAAAAGATGVPLALIPVGTANNFGRAAGVPEELQRACVLAARGERLRPMELGRAGELPFVNLASAGLAPVAAIRAERLKRVLGSQAYTVGAAAAALRTPPLECRVKAGKKTVFAGRTWQAMVAVSGAFGSGVRVEAAEAGDGKLDLVVVEADARWRLLGHAYRMRERRVVAERTRGILHERAVAFDIDVPAATPFNVDGEVVELGPTRFTVERAGFQLVVG